VRAKHAPKKQVVHAYSIFHTLFFHTLFFHTPFPVTAELSLL
jgi:hypothetical protein